MASFNKIILVGNLGRDAELRYTPAGKPVATVSIAIDDPFVKDEATGRPVTEWYRVKIWGKQAETLKNFLVKGKQVYVEGRLSIQRWNGREGDKRYTPEVSADRVQLLGGPGGPGGAGGAGGPARAAVSTERDAVPSDELGQGPEVTDDDIPF